MGSLVACSHLLHKLSFSKHDQQQGGICSIQIPAKQRSRRRVWACCSDAEKAAPCQTKRKEKHSLYITNRRGAMLAFLAISASPLSAFGSEAYGETFSDKTDMGFLETSKSQKSEIADAASPPQHQSAIAEFKDENKSQGSIVFGLVNEFGIIGSGILGALYMLKSKEMVAAESKIDAVRAQLKEKEVAMESLRDDLEGRIQLEQDKSLKQAKKAQEELSALSKELISAKGMVTALQKQLGQEKKTMQEREEQVEKFKSEILRAQKDNRTLQTDLEEKKSRLNELEDKVKLAITNVQEKEKEIDSLKFSLKEREKNFIEISLKADQTREALSQAEDQVKELWQALDNAKNLLHQKELSLKDLNARYDLAVVEKKDNKEKLVTLHEELNQMKLNFEKDLVSARQAIFVKQEQVNRLKEKLDIAYEEDNNTKGIIANLQKEKSNLEGLLEEKTENMKHLSCELQRSVESLEVSRSQVTTLLSDLATSQQLKAQLESEIVRLQNDRDAIHNSLEKRVHEEEQTSGKLSNELASVKKALDTSRNELLLLNKKLKESTSSYENIKEELSQVCKTAETTFATLNEKKKVVADLSSKLEASERTFLEEKEDKRLLQRDFEEATKSMDDMRSCIMSLSEELEIAKSKINTLEAEKDSLYESLEEQKELSKEVQEGAEHAKKILVRLGKEKDAYLKRATKLEEELSSAKGEILRLRKQMIWTKTVSRETQKQKEKETKIKQSHYNDRPLADVSLQIESMQAELSQIQKKLGDADQNQVETAGTRSLLDEGENLEKPSQGTVSVTPVSAHDTD